MVKYLLTWLALAGLLVAGIVLPTAAHAQAIQVTMGIDGMV
ncbi:MAG: hypothetical protein RX318_08960 [bacterium]|nr:hypothetical protein [bacterium]